MVALNYLVKVYGYNPAEVFNQQLVLNLKSRALPAGTPIADTIAPMRYVDRQRTNDAVFPRGRRHYWKAGWQQEVEGHRPDVNTAYASMHADMYPETKPLYRTAEAAGNLVAQPHTSSVEDANAHGFGTFVADDADGNPPTKARGVWDRITATSCRWHQAVSKDGGQVWEPNWFMDWVRA